MASCTEKRSNARPCAMTSVDEIETLISGRLLSRQSRCLAGVLLFFLMLFFLMLYFFEVVYCFLVQPSLPRQFHQRINHMAHLGPQTGGARPHRVDIDLMFGVGIEHLHQLARLDIHTAGVRDRSRS